MGSTFHILEKKRGLTQSKLGEIIGVGDKAVSKWETGEGLPDIGTLPSLAVALNTSVDSILNGGPISTMRLIKSLGADEDIQKVKFAVITMISVIMTLFSLKNLFSFIVFKEQFITMAYYGEWGFSPDMNLNFSLKAITLLILISTFMSFLIYAYYKRELLGRSLFEKANLFEVILFCAWLAPYIYIFGYALTILPFVDDRVLIYFSTCIYFLISGVILKRFLKKSSVH